ncbi:MAG: NEW3 domain-containing protein, partial [Anaerolineae bacterium]
TETIAWRVHNYGETAADVRVEVDLPDGWELVSLDRAAFTVAPGACKDAVATVTVGPIDEDIDVSVGATLLLDGTPNDVARIYYRLAYPLDVPEGARWSAHTALGDILANDQARAVLAKHLPPTLLHDPRLSEPRLQAMPLATVARWAGGLVTQEALRAIHEELVRL